MLETVQQEESCDKVETVRKFTYQGDRVSAGCEAVVTARTTNGWVKLGKHGDILHGNRFPLRVKGAVYDSYVNQKF